MAYQIDKQALLCQPVPLVASGRLRLAVTVRQSELGAGMGYGVGVDLEQTPRDCEDS